MLGALFNTEKIVSDTIKTSLEEIAIELGCDYKSFFVMIKPKNEQFEMSFYIYKIVGQGKNPQFVREISLKEILGQE
jgi:hypothetical protein